MHFNRHIRKENKDELVFKPLEVVVTASFEDACRRFKTLVQNEGIIANYKARQTYEKPSEKKRRKRREAAAHRLIMANREALILSGEWEKRQKKKEAKRLEKIEERKSKQTSE